MTDIKVSEYQDWLKSRGYQPRTIDNYSRPLRYAAERGLCFADIEHLDAEELYIMIIGHGGSRHTMRATHQSVYSYREFLGTLEV